MSHKSVVNLIKETAQSLADNIKFGYGLDTDFNVQRDKSYPFIWLDPLTASPEYTVNNTENYQKTWNVRMLFYQLDYKDSLPDQYSKILNDMDTIVDMFVQQLNGAYSWETGPVTLTLSSISQQPFIKATGDILTGWIVTFNLTVPDDFNYCTPGQELIDNGLNG